MASHSAYRWALVVALGTVLILMVPLLAMQFSDEVVWTPADFVVAGVLLFGTGLAFVLVARRSGNIVYRLAVGAALGSALFLVWVILAVGVIGDSGDPEDLMYIAVLAVGLVGAIIARLRPRGMARALVAMAIAQVGVAGTALIGGMVPAYNSAYEILGVNAMFVALFLGSAWLFRAAAEREQAAAATVPQG